MCIRDSYNGDEYKETQNPNTADDISGHYAEKQITALLAYNADVYKRQPISNPIAVQSASVVPPNTKNAVPGNPKSSQPLISDA